MQPWAIERSFALLGLAMARALPIAWLVPMVGGSALPVLVRVALGAGLAAFCLPALMVQPLDFDALGWMLLGIREALVGVVIGFVVACMFRAADAAGSLIDVVRGPDLGETPTPPASGSARSPFASFMFLLAMVIFFEIGGPGHIAAALAHSYQAVPISSSLTARSLAAMAMVAIAASAMLIESAIGLCAPVLVALVLTDVILAVIARAAPRLSPGTVGKPLKALLGVAMVLLVLAGLDVALRQVLGRFLQLVRAAGALN